MSDQQSTALVNYRDVVGIPGYRVGDDGSIWSTRGRGNHSKEWRPLKCRYISGYPIVTLCKDRKRYHRLVHRLILEAFKGPPPFPDACALHSPDPDITNMHPSNLRWGTRADNMAECIAQGRHAKGTAKAHAKLDENKVREIRILAKTMSKPEIAKRFGVHRATIHEVINGETWTHVS